MTYYLHNNQLFEIDRMPPAGHFSRAGKRWSNYYTYLSTLQPIPHELKGEGIQVEGKDFDWRYEGLKAERIWVIITESAYNNFPPDQRRKVAVPIEAKLKNFSKVISDNPEEIKDFVSKNMDEQEGLVMLEQASGDENNEGEPKQYITDYTKLAPQQQPAKETMLEQLADLLRNHDVRKYVNANDSGYSQVERDIVDLFTPAHSSVSNPVAKELKQIRDAFQWTFDNMGTPHTSDHFNVPANAIEQLDNLIGLFTSRPDSGESQEKVKVKVWERFLKGLHLLTTRGVLSTEEIITELQQHYHITPKNKQP